MRGGAGKSPDTTLYGQKYIPAGDLTGIIESDAPGVPGIT
jgi:hypothetical protein